MPEREIINREFDYKILTFSSSCFVVAGDDDLESSRVDRRTDVLSIKIIIINRKKKGRMIT